MRIFSIKNLFYGKKLFLNKNANSLNLVIGLVVLILVVFLAIYFMTGINDVKVPVIGSTGAPLLLFFSRKRLEEFLC